MRAQPGHRLLFLLLPLLLAAGMPLIWFGRRDPKPPELAPGLTYSHRIDPRGPWSIHVVTLDLDRDEYRLAAPLALGEVFGLSPVSQQAIALRTEQYEPWAAVNGDFFRIQPGPYQGDMLGLKISGGELISSPAVAAFWIQPDGQPRIGPVRSRISVAWGEPEAASLRVGLNQPRADSRAVLYTPALGPSTRAPAGGVELVLAAAGGEPLPPLRPGASIEAVVAEITGDGDAPMPEGGMVLSIGPDRAMNLPEPAPGMALRIDVATTPDLAGVETAIGGGPILVAAGRVRPSGRNPGRDQRHPRTAVGFNRGRLFLVAVDGRQPRLSVGMSERELADLMADLGADYALNLDGGGSTTLWLAGRVINSPSGLLERPVANSLVILRRADEVQ